jgi:glycosyltransferase involved in cell wall biosynthesis
MKVLQINQSDISGGAAIAAYRLHQGLLSQNIDSRLLVGTAKTNDDRVDIIPRNQSWERQILRLSRRLDLNYVHYAGAFNISQHEFYKNADLLNFHSLHSGTFNYLAIPSLTKQKPAVFTLHDMWNFTGHCAYSYDCDRWKTGCGKCPYPDSYPKIKRDNTQLEWRLKKWVYDRSNLTIITLSQWLTEQAQQSILSQFPIHHIPNGIDTEVYQPIDQKLCRTLLAIPSGKKVLMFAAQSLEDKRKGGDFLMQALTQLPLSLKSDLLLLTIGDGGERTATDTGIETLNLGYVGSDRLKSIAYSSADLFVFPTRADNLPLVLQESMACGTPMISVRIGGVPDLVRPTVTGYLAEPEDAVDFSDGIVKLLEDEELLKRMRQNCRAIAVEEYSLELQAQRYINLYRQMLSH